MKMAKLGLPLSSSGGRVGLFLAAAVTACNHGGDSRGAGAGGTDASSSSGTDASSGADAATEGGDGLGSEDAGGPVFTFGTGSDAGGGVCAGGVVGGSRPVQVRTSTGYASNTPSPLVILLHDYGSSGAEAEAYLNLAAQADALGFLYAHPDGTKDSQSNEFWNATDACCNIDGSAVDDSAYLDELLLQVHVQYNTDERRVYVVGYGNGGFMAYRLACDHSRDVTAVADLGGATWADSSKCPTSGPMSVLEIHGTLDGTFAYDGGTNLGVAYPSAMATASDWVKLDHCPDASAAPPGAGLDLLDDDAGTDTTVTRWPGCRFGTDIVLWSILGGTHRPPLAPSFAPTLLQVLLSHVKP